MWKLEKIGDLAVLRYNPSMISMFLYPDDFEKLVKFFSNIDSDKLEFNKPVSSEGCYYSLNPNILDNGHRIVELYFAEKGFAFVVFMEYFIELIELCRKEVNNVG